MSDHGAESSVPNPESPDNHFKVRVISPESILNILPGSTADTNVIPIGATNLGDDPVFRALTTTLIPGSLTHSRGANVDRFGLWTKMVLSDRRCQQPDKGFFSDQKVDGIRQVLQAKGFDVTRETPRPSCNELAIQTKGYTITLDFGFSSEEAFKQTDSYRFHFININIGDQTAKNTLPLPKSDVETAGIFNLYAQVYEKIVRAIYETEELPVPNVTVLIKPANLSEDTIAALDSVGTERSPTTTKEAIPLPQFSDIVGQKEAVLQAELLIAGMENPAIYKKRGVERPHGYLLAGPAGTGKTTLARAIARESGAQFLSMSLAKIRSEYYSKSLQLMEAFFDNAKAIAVQGEHVLIFIDEIDGLTPAGGAWEETEAQIAILKKNLSELQDIEGITVIAATNHSEKIQPEVIRSGRFDQTIWMDIPQTDEERSEVFQFFIDQARNKAEEPESLFDPNIDLSNAASLAKDLSQADIRGVVNRVLWKKVGEEALGKSWMPTTTEELKDMIQQLKHEIKVKRGIVSSL